MSIHMFSSLRCRNCPYTSKMCCNFHPVLAMRCRMCREKGAHLCGGCGEYSALYSKLPADQVEEFQVEALKAEAMTEGELREFLEGLKLLHERRVVEACLNALMSVPCPRVRTMLEERWVRASEIQEFYTRTETESATVCA